MIGRSFQNNVFFNVILPNMSQLNLIWKIDFVFSKHKIGINFVFNKHQIAKTKFTLPSQRNQAREDYNFFKQSCVC